MQKLLLQFAYEKLALIDSGLRYPEAARQFPDVDWLAILTAAYAIETIAFILASLSRYFHKDLNANALKKLKI